LRGTCCLLLQGKIIGKYLPYFMTLHSTAQGLLFGVCSVRILVVRGLSWLWSFYGFPQSLQENTGIIPRLSYYRFLPNPS
jgi:hypothetical protein